MSAAPAKSYDVTVLAESLRGPLLRVSRRLRQEAQKDGLSSQDAVILGYLKKHPGAGVSELAAFEQISRPTMSSHVKRLEAAGWIRRADDVEDGRRQCLTLTPAGRRKHDEIQRRRNDWLASRLVRLTDNDRAALSAAAPALLKLLGLDA